MKPFIFNTFREKDKDPEIYRVKVLLWSVYKTMLKKGITDKKDFEKSIKDAEDEIGPNPKLTI